MNKRRETIPLVTGNTMHEQLPSTLLCNTMHELLPSTLNCEGNEEMGYHDFKKMLSLLSLESSFSKLYSRFKPE